MQTAPGPAPAFVPVLGLHHLAYRCRDAEETRAFYEDLLGLPLVHVITSDIVPSTGEHCPYVHVFFRMDDGSCIAFFDLGDDLAADPSPNTPMWVAHVALRVQSLARLEEAKSRLEAAGVHVVGVTDHGFIRSIYFFDPNGIRLELTVEVGEPKPQDEARRKARKDVAEWTARKERLRAEGAIAPTAQRVVRSHADPAYR